MRAAHENGDQLVKEAQPGVRRKELRGVREQLRVKRLLNTRKINFSIFGPRMIAVYQQCSQHEA